MYGRSYFAVSIGHLGHNGMWKDFVRLISGFLTSVNHGVATNYLVKYVINLKHFWWPYFIPNLGWSFKLFKIWRTQRNWRKKFAPTVWNIAILHDSSSKDSNTAPAKVVLACLLVFCRISVGFLLCDIYLLQLWVVHKGP